VSPSWPRRARSILPLAALLCAGVGGLASPGSTASAGAVATPHALRAAAAPPTGCALRLIKPQPPIDVTLEPIDSLKPGRVARFRLVVVPRVPTDEIRVLAQPAPEVAWVAGERSARRAARRDERGEFTFSVRVPVSGRHALYVQVEITGADGKVWRRGVGLGLGPNPRAERARAIPDGRGGQVLEYEAAAADRLPGDAR
jgi:hypothetical protein